MRGAYRGFSRLPQPQKQVPKGKPSLPRGGWQYELPRVMADPRWNTPSTSAAMSQSSTSSTPSSTTSRSIASPFAMPDPLRSPSKTVIPAEARRQGIISVQEYMNEDTSIALPPPVATEELVDANAPKMKPPQKMMYSEDGLKGASFIEKLSKNVVSTPFIPCILDATAPEHVTETLTPTGIDEAFAVVEQRRQDLGALSPYPDVQPLAALPADQDADLTWAMSQERDMTPHLIFFYKIKELETIISHDTIALRREVDPVARAKLQLGLEIMKRKLSELRERVGQGGGTNRSSTPQLEGDAAKSGDEAPAKRVGSEEMLAPPASPMDDAEKEIEPYKDSDEEEQLPEETSTSHAVTPAEAAAFEEAFVDKAAWTPLPDDGPI